MKRTVVLILFLTEFCIQASCAYSESYEDIEPEGDSKYEEGEVIQKCLPYAYYTDPLCRGMNNFIDIDIYNWSDQCGSLVYDGDYNVYLRRNGNDVAFLGGPAEMWYGDLSFSTSFFLSLSSFNDYEYQLRRVTDGHEITFYVSAADCVFLQPSANEEVTGGSLGTVRWNTVYFSGNVEIALRRAETGAILQVLTASTANDGQHQGTYISVNDEASVYLTLSDGTVSYNSAVFTLSPVRAWFNNPSVNGYQVGTRYPNYGSNPADSARRFCQDRNYFEAESYATSIRSTVYSYIVGGDGIGSWSVTGNSGVTVLDSIVCVGSSTTHQNPTISGYKVGTRYPTFGSTPADTARRFCQDNGYVGGNVKTTSTQSTTYSYINGVNGIGNWSVTGNSGVTVLDSIACFGAGQTYQSPKVYGYEIGTRYPTYGSSPADTARRFCQDSEHFDAGDYTVSIRSAVYSYISGTSGLGSWSVTGNSGVTMLDSVTCID